MNKTRRKNKALSSYTNLIIRHPHTRYSYKTKSCSARKKNDGNTFSCYTNKILFELRNKWNERHPENKIFSDKPIEIWKEYQLRINGLCRNEQCWIKHIDDTKENRRLRDEMKMSFAPEKPDYVDKNEWLSNIDIAKVLKMYERVYPCFEFLGPTPIDYDAKSQGRYVCNKIATFDLNSFIQKGIFKIGIVFNLDNHRQGGSHWVCVFINVKESMIYYFDSVAKKMNIQIKKLINKVIQQGRNLQHPVYFQLETNKTVHQRKNNECGVYCLFVITSLLEDTKTLDDFKVNRFSDDEVYDLRKIFFQKD